MHSPLQAQIPRPLGQPETQLHEEPCLTLREADCAVERGDLVEAGARYMALLRKRPESGDAWLGLSRVLLMGGEFECATDLVDRTIAHEHKGKAWLVLSHVLIARGELDRAAELIDRSIALQPKDPYAYFLQAVVFRNTLDFEAELNALRRATRHLPTDPQLWQDLISALEKVSGPEAAIDYLEDNRAALPSDVGVDLRKAQLCACAGQFRKLDTILRRVRSVLEGEPDNMSDRLALARCLAAIGQEEEAFKLLRELTKQNWKTARPFVALADLLRLDDTTISEAIQNLRRAMSLEPENTGLLRDLADCHARQARYDKAADLLTGALQMANGGSLTDHLRLGIALRQAGRTAQAREHFRKALAKASEEVRTAGADVQKHQAMSAILARILVILGRREEALLHYRKMFRHRSDIRLSYQPGLYLPSTPNRLEKLRERIGGRDTVVLLDGRSLSAVDRGEQLASLDMCVAAIGPGALEGGFLSGSGLSPDVLLATHYRAVRNRMRQILQFLEHPTNNVLVTNRWVMDRLGTSCPSRRELEKRFDDRLLYIGAINATQPATPYDPLSYVAGDSLSVLISLLAIGGAKRIFLLGGDNGTLHDASELPPGDPRKESSPADATRDPLCAIPAMFRPGELRPIDAIETGLLSAEGLFGVEPPPIFEVSSYASLRGFPRITYSEALSMLSEEGQQSRRLDQS